MAPPAPQQLADTFVEKADSARTRGEDELAWGWLQKAMALYRAEKDDRGIASAGRRLASLLARRGDLRGALRQAEEARGAAELAWNRPDMASIDYVVGAIHCQLGEIELGLRWLHRSVDMWGELGRVDGQIRAWRRIAHAQSVDGDLGAGLAAWSRCLAVYRHQSDVSGEAGIHTEAAQACINAGRPDLALTHALAALGRHRHLQIADKITEDLGLMIIIQGQLGGSAYQERLRQHLDEDSAVLVTALVEVEAKRRDPSPSPSPSPPPSSPPADSEAPGDPSADDWESVFWSRSSDQSGEDGAVLMPDHRPLELVTVFGKLIVVMVGVLLLLLVAATLRAVFIA